MDGQEENGLLKPPSSSETTDLPVEGLAQAAPLRIMTMDEADLLRATRAFKNDYVLDDMEIDKISCLNKIAFEFSEMIIQHFPASKERSQALGNVQQVVMWCEAAIKNQPKP